ncbi:sulfatase-like hydrolase/transferase [Pontiella desulfatans]|uniref:sulfatase-like hydrolase/transferase n=1 Tax=Pontiella desulfatans TaxID=2750659 RepID=UPI00109D1CA0
MPRKPRRDKSGLLFEHACCQTAVCMPSRGSVLSGLRPESFGCSGRFPPKVAKKATSLPLFKNEGYATVSIGKIDHANADVPQETPSSRSGHPPR